MANEDEVQDRASRGGKARAEKLSPEQRREIAIAGAVTRWGKDLPVAEYGSPDKPLRIGKLEIPCYVLSDGRRVLVQRGMMVALDMKQGTAGRGGGDRLAKFARTKGLTPFISPELAEMITKPILFQVERGQTAYGYEATILADLCDAVLAARKAGALNYQQQHIAEQCEILVRGFARVGIVALVDEATGYQKVRQERDLAAILEKFISKELKKWVRRFPFEYYEEMFRLRNWDTSDLTPNSPKPVEVGKITDDLIYKRLAPGVRQELKKLTPRNPKGYLVNKLHQHLTDEIGNPKLEKHISNIVTIMKLSDDWSSFMKNVNKVLPQYGKNFELQLGD
ncbi:MAG: P63C domain-containing protein [Gemmatimonadales bacterium]